MITKNRLKGDFVYIISGGDRAKFTKPNRKLDYAELRAY